jgi:hypothetical protein
MPNLRAATHHKDEKTTLCRGAAAAHGAAYAAAGSPVASVHAALTKTPPEPTPSPSVRSTLRGEGRGGGSYERPRHGRPPSHARAGASLPGVAGPPPPKPPHLVLWLGALLVVGVNKGPLNVLQRLNLAAFVRCKALLRAGRPTGGDHWAGHPKRCGCQQGKHRKTIPPKPLTAPSSRPQSRSNPLSRPKPARRAPPALCCSRSATSWLCRRLQSAGSTTSSSTRYLDPK